MKTETCFDDGTLSQGLYPTFKEWKLCLTWFTKSPSIIVYILPLRNENFSIAKNLQGRTPNVYILPLRNENYEEKIGKCLDEIEVYILPLRNENVRGMDSLKLASDVYILPLRNENPQL